MEDEAGRCTGKNRTNKQRSKIKNYRDLTSSQYGIKRDGMPIRT
jgi:hypothetical protein